MELPNEGENILSNLRNALEQGQLLVSQDTNEAILIYRRLFKQIEGLIADNITGKDSELDAFSQSTKTTGEIPEDIYRIQERVIYSLAHLYVKVNEPCAIRNLIVDCRGFFNLLPKVRTAKIVRTLIDLLSWIPDSSQLQEELCEECIRWCIVEKRTFLRLRVQSRLALLYLQQSKLQLGLSLVEKLLKEVKKLDDKLLLVEIYLVESRLYFMVKNISRSKAALTAARTTANAIHCPPLLQGDIDLQAGILHAQERDLQTAFSYFIEAYEAFSSNSSLSSGFPIGIKPPDDSRALQALKYMILSRIICGQPDEVSTIMSGKQGLKYLGNRDLEALKAIAKCYKSRSLQMFQETLIEYKDSIDSDTFLSTHINDLNETLLEQNLQKILEPFSKVEVSHVSKLIDLPLERIQSKLEEMILDNKLQGTLDQGKGILILFDDIAIPSLYEDVLSTIVNMSNTVDILQEKVR